MEARHRRCCTRNRRWPPTGRHRRLLCV